MTQEELARRVGVTQGRISQIISGETPRLKLAVAIEDATSGNVTVRELLKGKGLPAERLAEQDRPSCH